MTDIVPVKIDQSGADAIVDLDQQIVGRQRNRDKTTDLSPCDDLNAAQAAVDVRRSKRARKSPKYLDTNYLNFTMMQGTIIENDDVDTGEWLESEGKLPRGFKDYMKSLQAKEWLEGMKRRYKPCMTRVFWWRLRGRKCRKVIELSELCGDFK